MSVDATFSGSSRYPVVMVFPVQHGERDNLGSPVLLELTDLLLESAA
jgi:hypothetical protein